MDENSGRSLSIDTYISRQENLLVEHIRRLLQAETKISLLETGLQEMHKRNQELQEQVDLGNVTIEQSLNGLKAVTRERDKLAEENQRLNVTLTDCNVMLNDKLVLETELNGVKEKLKIAEGDYATLKENYNRVLALIPQSSEPEPGAASVSTKKSKKPKSTESEWTIDD